MMYTRNIMFHSMHKDWYICEHAGKSKRRKDLKLALDFYKGEPDVLPRCSFIGEPIPEGMDKRKNCHSVLGPVETPAISGQPLWHPGHLVPPPTPPPLVGLPACLPVCPATATTPLPGITSAPIPSRRKSFPYFLNSFFNGN